MNKYFEKLDKMFTEVEYNIFQPLFAVLGCFVGFIIFIPISIVLPFFRSIILVIRGLYEEINE